MKKGSKKLLLAFLIFALPIICAYLWGLHKANTVVPQPNLLPSEVDAMRAYIIQRWTGSGILVGLILFAYIIGMRIVFAVVGGITNTVFWLARRVTRNPQKRKPIKPLKQTGRADATVDRF